MTRTCAEPSKHVLLREGDTIAYNCEVPPPSELYEPNNTAYYVTLSQCYPTVILPGPTMQTQKNNCQPVTSIIHLGQEMWVGPQFHTMGYRVLNVGASDTTADVIPILLVHVRGK
jgi:hypothetical protein